MIKPEISVTMDLTKLCNNRCLYCFAYPEGDTTPETTISYEDACRLLRIVQNEFAVTSVRFTGGEPTLHPRLADLIGFASHVIAPQTVTLLSNGRRLRDPQLCRSLYDAGLLTLQVSLESNQPQIHDRMVGIHGAWVQTVEGIKTALRLHPRPEQASKMINVKATITDLNAHTLSDTIHFIAGLGIQSLSMNVCSPAGRGQDHAAIIPGMSERVQILSRAQELAEGLGLYFESHVSFDLCVENPEHTGLRHYACGRGRSYIALDFRGNLYMCNFWGKRGGNLLETGSVRALWEADDLKYYWYGRHLPDRCRACPRVRDCGGVCPISAEAFGWDHIYDQCMAPQPEFESRPPARR